MGAVVSAISGAFEGIGRAVSGVVSAAGKIVSNVVQSIGKDPITAIAKIAAVATGNAWAIPLIDGVSTLAKGGSIGQALIAGGASYVGSWVAGALPIGEALAGTGLAAAATQAVQGGVSSFIRSGGNLEAGLSGALSGAVTGGVGEFLGNSGIGQDIAGVGLGAAGSKLIGDVIGGGVNALARGKNFEEGAASGAVGGLFNWAQNGISGVTNDVSDFLSNTGGNEQLQAQNQEVANLNTQLEQVGTDYTSTQEQARNLNDQFTQEATRYNEATAPYGEAVTAAQQPYNELKAQLQSKVDTYYLLRAQYDASPGDDSDLEARVQAAGEDANNFHETQFKPAQDNLQAAVDGFNEVHNANIESYNAANALRGQATEQITRLNELRGQGDTLSSDIRDRATALQEEVTRYQDQVETQAAQGIGATNYDEYGRELGPNGETIQRFDDGSVLTTNADGTIESYDSEGQVYNGQGEAAAPNEKQANYWKALQGGAGARAQATRRATAPQQPSGRGAASMAGAALPAAGAAALGAVAASRTPGGPQGAQESTDLDQVASEAPAYEKPADYDLFGFLNDKGSALMNVPGVTNFLQQNKPTDYGLIEPGNPSANQPSAADPYSLLSSATNQPGAKVENPNDYLDELSPYADGGPVAFNEGGFMPQFFSEGGSRHVEGAASGTEDSVPSLLSSGEYVIPGDIVAALGDGNNDAGAGVLDKFIRSIREHKQSNGVELPPDSKGPLSYLKEAGA